MKRTRSHIILSIVPLVALIGVFFGMGMYHIVRNSRATFKDAYAQEYEAMPAVMQRPMDVQSSGVVPDPLLSSSVAEGSVPDAVQSLARLKDYIAHLKEKSLSLEEKLSLVNQLLTLRNEEVDELKQSNSALDNRIRQLSGELEQKARQIGRFDEALRQRTEFLDEKVRLLNQLLSSRDEELRRLRTENTDLEANLDRLFEAHLKLKEDFDNNVGELSEELGRKRLEVTNLNVMKYVKFSLQSQISELS
ncbi:MAG: hypothetical protein MJA29_06310, partial [Candidatus Omnitrophica bacterium]|nr:hypothetical protein [Candidatus Omnitrophota bacterium]